MTSYQFQLLIMVLASLAAWLAFIKVQQISQQVREVHLSLNSRLDQLIEVTRTQAHERGMAEGLASRSRPPDGARE